jgi:hypothetical protein
MRVEADRVVAPVMYDFSTIDPQIVQQYRGGDMFRLFQRGLASFDDDLQNAVALNHGIDDDGQLDMNMLQAAETAEGYLRGRQGQPVVVADLLYKSKDSMVRIDALVGVLGSEDTLVGTFDRDGWKVGGISLQDQCYKMSAVGAYGPIRHDRTSPESGEGRSDRIMQLKTSAITLGVVQPESDTYWTQQELLAGDDIITWLIEEFGEDEGYELFTGIMMGVRDAEAQKYLLQEPFTTRMKREQAILLELGSKLEAARRKVRAHEAAYKGALAEAYLGLAAVAEEAGDLRHRLPSTNDSNRTSIDDEVIGLSDIEARQRAVQQSQEYLGKLIVR